MSHHPFIKNVSFEVTNPPKKKVYVIKETVTICRGHDDYSRTHTVMVTDDFSNVTHYTNKNPSGVVGYGVPVYSFEEFILNAVTHESFR